jgi:hypothetical protein
MAITNMNPAEPGEERRGDAQAPLDTRHPQHRRRQQRHATGTFEASLDRDEAREREREQREHPNGPGRPAERLAFHQRDEQR